MKSNDLRIGNIVKTENNTIDVFKLVSIGYDYVLLTDEYNDYDSLIEELKPIPITEEWLLKLGFEYHAFDKNYVITTKDDWHNSIKEIEGDWCYNNDSSDAGCYFVRDVKYVHQLQNLYYAINEEELTIK